MASTVWKGHLTFGLVSFPIKLYSAARSESISFNQLHKADGSRVKQVLFCQAEDKPIPRSEIVKGYEYEKDRYVVIEDEEVKKVAPVDRQGDGDPGIRQGRPGRPDLLRNLLLHGARRSRRKTLRAAVRGSAKTGYVGVAKIAMHNREHIVILRPGKNGVLLHTMYYNHEIRKVDEFRTDLSLVKEKELALATSLVEALAGEFEPDKYKDTYRENLLQMIEAKKQGQEVVATPEPQQAKVVDILEALKASLAMAKKPAASATTSEPQQPSKLLPRVSGRGDKLHQPSDTTRHCTTCGTYWILGGEMNQTRRYRSGFTARKRAGPRCSIGSAASTRTTGTLSGSTSCGCSSAGRLGGRWWEASKMVFGKCVRRFRASG